MHHELKMATSDLANFLQEKLPELSDQWWQEHVVERLSFQQQRVVGEKKITVLRELDFAALLRILDQNWYDLSKKITFPREARNWVKELQTVRNRWAHMAAEETPASEVYRDAETLGRLLALIDANERSVNAVQAARDAALASMTDSAGVTTPFQTEAATGEIESTSKAPIHLFKIGDVVTLRSDRNIKLPVLEVITEGPEVRYRVFQDNAIHGSSATVSATNSTWRAPAETELSMMSARAVWRL